MTESLIETINLFDLEIEGATIVSKQLTGREAGEYSTFHREIALRTELTPYWFATFTTLLHECGHHRQRHLIYAILFTAIVASAGTYIYDYLGSQGYNLLLYGITMAPIFIMVVLLKIFYIEQDADSFMIMKLPDIIFLFISQIEIVEIAQSIGRDNLLRALTALHKEMQVYFPELLG